MKMCVQREDVKSTFVNEWRKFFPAILLYCRNSKKRTLIQHAQEIDDTGENIYIHDEYAFLSLLICWVFFIDDEMRQISALKALSVALSPKGMKDSTCYIYNEYDVRVTMISYVFLHDMCCTAHCNNIINFFFSIDHYFD